MLLGLMMLASGGLACQDQPLDEGAYAGIDLQLGESDDTQSLTRTCAAGETLRGIDVSYYQGEIDWDAVQADGVSFAFIRVSDGRNHSDSQFARNLQEARRVGLRRGVYQFFRPDQDVNAQADLLINGIQVLQQGDLPPVLDVEDDAGLSSAALQARVKQWLDRVEAALGVKAIIYTGAYFWRDEIGDPAWALDYPLWVAHYTSSCALTPEPWSRWVFHQYTDRGRVNGIDGNVDTNNFNGDLSALDAITVGSDLGGAWQDETDSASDSDNSADNNTDSDQSNSTSAPEAQPSVDANDGTEAAAPAPPPSDANGCPLVPASGATIEEDGNCTTLIGPAEYFRAEGSGHSGGHLWTGSVARSEYNSVRTTLPIASGGTYLVEAYVEAGGEENSAQARYRISHAGGEDEIIVNQKIAQGFTALGYFSFAGGQSYSLTLGDKTGEPNDWGRRVIFDAIRLTPEAEVSCRHLRISDDVYALNLRPLPNTSQDAIGQLAGGQQVTRLGSVGGESIYGNSLWYQIQDGDRVGFISGYYASCVSE